MVMAMNYNVCLVPEINSKSRSLTLLFWYLVMLSLAGESNRSTQSSGTLDFLERFSISNADSTVSFLICWCSVQCNRKCSAVCLSELADRNGGSASSMTVVFQHGIYHAEATWDMKFRYLGHLEIALWFEQMEWYCRCTVQCGHNPSIAAMI